MNFQSHKFIPSSVASRPKSCSLETLAIINGILESPASQHPLVDKLRIRLSSEGNNGLGYVEFQRRLNVMDKDGSQLIHFEDFKTVIQKCQLGFDENETWSLFKLFVDNDKRYLDIHEFFLTIRGAINPFRRQFIDKIFNQLDYLGEGILSCEEVIERYDPSQHPDAKNHFKRSSEIFREFLRTFEVGGEVENKISKNEFYNYYFNLSASIDDDHYFEAVITSTWNFSASQSRQQQQFQAPLDQKRTSAQTHSFPGNSSHFVESTPANTPFPPPMHQGRQRPSSRPFSSARVIEEQIRNGERAEVYEYQNLSELPNTSFITTRNYPTDTHSGRKPQSPSIHHPKSRFLQGHEQQLPPLEDRFEYRFHRPNQPLLTNNQFNRREQYSTNVRYLNNDEETFQY